MLALTDHDAQAWTDANAPYDGLPTRKAVPEQAWLLPDGTEVLVTAGCTARSGSARSPGRDLVALGPWPRPGLDRDRSDLVATSRTSCARR